MKYYKLSKQGTVIDQILSSFDGWDFYTYPKVIDRIANPPVMSQVTLDGGQAGAAAWLTAYAEGDYEGWLKVRTTGNDGGIIFTADLNPGVETRYNNATKTFTLSGDSWSSYLKFPENKGTSEEPAIIATLGDINGAFVHTGSPDESIDDEIYGTKIFRTGGISFSSVNYNDVINITGNGTNAEIRICPTNTSFPTFLHIGSTSNNYGELTFSTYESISQSHPSSEHAIIKFVKGSGSTAKNAYLIIPNVGTSSDPKTIATTEDIPTLHSITMSEGHSSNRVITFLVMTKISSTITLTDLLNTDIASTYFINFSFGGTYSRNTAPYYGTLQIRSADQSGMTYTVHPGDGSTLVENITWSEVSSWSSFTDHVLN